MQFNKIFGKVDSDQIDKAQKRISSVLVELATAYSNKCFGTAIGGDPLIFSLLAPIEQICTLGISTAATDGKRYYWNPYFVNKLTKIGLRIVCAHEAFHAQFMHPQRRGDRHPKLWNICVDYMVHDFIMEDFTKRSFNAADLFTKNLGPYISVAEYAEFLKNPMKDKNGEIAEAEKSANASSAKVPRVTENRELFDPEKKILDAKAKRASRFFADPAIPEELKSPDKLYDYFYSLLPKCPKCGKVGVYSKQKGPKKDQDQNDGNSGGDQKDDQQDGDQKCDHGGGHGDVFDVFDTLDDHIDANESQEKLAKRLADAIDNAKQMAGHVPAGLEDELGKLVEPKIIWQDKIKSRILRAKEGTQRNDWTKFRSRPMFYGMALPKRRSNSAKFACLLDTSGSMAVDDMAQGLSQLQALDSGSEGIVVPCDAEVYWDKATKLRNVTSEEISRVKPHGRGGTILGSFFTDYKDKIGEVDFIIVVTDGYLMESDIVNMKDPGIPVYWLITSYEANNHRFPFGKVYNIKNS